MDDSDMICAAGRGARRPRETRGGSLATGFKLVAPAKNRWQACIHMISSFSHVPST